LAIAKVLGDYNIRLALEFVGPDTCRVGPKSHGPTPFIHTMPQTLELIETIDAPQNNVGLLLDTFHWFTSHGTVENLLMLTPDKIVHVHINDAPNVPISEQEDFKRLLPGDGVINLVGFLKSLGYIGYTGFVAVETFNKELSSQGHEIAAQKTGAAMERLLAQLH
jgi:sugar phosphate isomerase/epimerase